MANVRVVQTAVVAAGHELTLDWTGDVMLTIDYASRLDVSAALAGEELDAVMTADAVLVVASEHDGRGMFVELGAALARAQRGELEHVVVVGDIRHERVSSTTTRWCSGWQVSRTGSLGCGKGPSSPNTGDPAY